MINITEKLIRKGTPAREGRARRKFRGVTIHETGNYSKGAGAYNHMLYQTVNGGQNQYVSYHYVLDDRTCYRLVPENEVSWHAGDGDGGNGNNETVSIELCVNPDSVFDNTFERAAELTADILKRNNITFARGWVYQHNNFSNKNCPATIREKNRWPEFLNSVQAYLDLANKPEKPKSNVYRVKVNGKQVGAYSVLENVLDQVKKAGLNNAKNILVELVE